MNNVKNYKYINIIRTFLCVSVLLYHFGILKGGYLAVCSFFVLSGYLAVISSSKKEFSIFKYYLSRVKKIYLPLLIVVFLSVFIISLFSNINWINLKPETTSVLLNYNNFWQLNANLDYFARHIDSPFMHLWYISILIQFDLVFPFLFIISKKIKEKISKFIPCIIVLLLAIVSYVYFYKLNIDQNLMMSYYNTFSRIFSLLFGVFLGFIHIWFQPLKLKNNMINKCFFWLYISVLIFLFVFIESQSIFFSISMLAVSLITCRLIEFSISDNETINIFDKFINFISKISYEIYLFQYPIIYLFSFINVCFPLKIIIMTVLIIILSSLLHFVVNKNKRFKILKFILCLVILPLCLFGEVKYFLAKDYTNEMNQLEQQLADNEKLMKEKQEKYEASMKAEEENWMSILAGLEDEESKLKDLVTNFQIVGIGDSVMLGAINNLYETFPNGYFDAKISRTAWVANDILKNLKNKNMLGEPIVLNLGANGDCPESCKIKIMKTIGNRKVFWINTTNLNHVNKELLEFSKKYNNLYIIDWKSISKNHPEYFIADKIHLTNAGKKAYTEAIYNSIYEVYLDEYNTKKEEILKEYEENMKNKISFYGNDILINAYSHVQNDFLDASFTIDKNFNFESLKTTILNSIEEKKLNYKIVFVFDSNLKLTEENYNELLELCTGHEIYILNIDENIINFSDERFTVIDFNSKLKNNSDYLMVDKIHLTEKGNKALCEILIKYLK